MLKMQELIFPPLLFAHLVIRWPLEALSFSRTELSLLSYWIHIFFYFYQFHKLLF